MAASSPGNRLSISEQRELLCISTPCRTVRIKPASRRALKWCDNVDLGICLLVTFKKVEQLEAHAKVGGRQKRVTRPGSEGHAGCLRRSRFQWADETRVSYRANIERLD